MRCPNCKAETSGRFCSRCGTPLVGLACQGCGAAAAPGARFCTKCGKALQGAAKAGVPLAWVVAAGAIIIALVAILMPRGDGTGGGTLPLSSPMGAQGATADDPLSGTPRDQADRLFNRIMTEKSNGNLEQAVFFAPMALQAYQMAEPLDADGLYHLSLIQAVASDFAGARATAQRILDAMPTHLLGLAALAEAALGAGDTTAARTAWDTFLGNFLNERSKGLQEYQDHAPILETYEQDARKLLGR